MPLGRTKGQWAVDTLIYPVVNNTGVFASSVVLTHLTNRGNLAFKSGTWLYRNLGIPMSKRRDLLDNLFMKGGMTKPAAQTFRMVAWSFIDGCALVPAVKILEDNRNNMAHKMDQWLGSESTDPSTYASEPKQTWGSVFGGRAITAGIVVPTALLVEKTKIGKHNLNSHLFYRPGIRMGKWLKQFDIVKNNLSSSTINSISRVTFFEAFYTSVCTAGLYVTSRFLASLGHKPELAPASPSNDNKINETPPAHNDNLAQHSVRLSQLLHPEMTEKPDTKVESVHKPQRVQEAEASLTHA